MNTTFKWPARKGEVKKPNTLNPNEIQILIADLKMDKISRPLCSRGDSNQVPADRYEILALDKATAKKLTSEDLQSLVAYGQGYLEEYRMGKYMFKPGPRGRRMADLDEAGIFNEMLEAVAMLKYELNRRV